MRNIWLVYAITAILILFYRGLLQQRLLDLNDMLFIAQDFGCLPRFKGCFIQRLSLNLLSVIGFFSY